MKRHDMAHVRGAPYHPMTRDKIERWHQTLKSQCGGDRGGVEAQPTP